MRPSHLYQESRLGTLFSQFCEPISTTLQKTDVVGSNGRTYLVDTVYYEGNDWSATVTVFLGKILSVYSSGPGGQKFLLEKYGVPVSRVHMPCPVYTVNYKKRLYTLVTGVILEQLVQVSKEAGLTALRKMAIGKKCMSVWDYMLVCGNKEYEDLKFAETHMKQTVFPEIIVPGIKTRRHLALL